jgi:sugar phosphate permease
MGIVYVGVALVGAGGPSLIKPLTEKYSFQTALMAIGLVMVLAWPIALLVLKDKPSDVGQFADGEAQAPPDVHLEPHTFGYLLGQWSFWLLLIGSLCSIGAIGAINQHMKLVFADQGFTNQVQLNAEWSTATRWILWSSIAGRLLIGWCSDKLSMKWVMTATYFIVAATVPLLLGVRPGGSVYSFAVVFGFAMGADYMLIPLMAAKQFGVNSLARAMAVILPVNTIGQTWAPLGVSYLREHFGSYSAPMNVVLALAAVGAVSILLLPRDTVGIKAA